MKNKLSVIGYIIILAIPISIVLLLFTSFQYDNKALFKCVSEDLYGQVESDSMMYTFPAGFKESCELEGFLEFTFRYYKEETNKLIDWFIVNHIEYRTCKLINEHCNVKNSCFYFGKKDYNFFCKEDLGFISYHEYAPYNLTKHLNSMIKTCYEAGDIIYQDDLQNNIKIRTCKSNGTYKIALSSYDISQVNLTIHLNESIKSLKNLETNEIYLVKNNSIKILISPYTSIFLEDVSRVDDNLEEAYNKSLTKYNLQNWTLTSNNTLKIMSTIPNWLQNISRTEIDIPQIYFDVLKDKNGSCLMLDKYKVCNEYDKSVNLGILEPYKLYNVTNYQVYSKLVCSYFYGNAVCPENNLFKEDINYYGQSWTMKDNQIIPTNKPKVFNNFTIVWNVPCLIWRNNNLFVDKSCDLDCVESCGISNDSCLGTCYYPRYSY